MVRYFLLLIPILFFSCNKDDVEYGFVDDRLQPYLDLFAEEGANRGLLLDLSPTRIEAFIQPVFSATVAGQCQRNEDRPNQVIIDQSIWDESDAFYREFLVFHELGHCILNRGHLDSKNSDGSCASIMHSVIGICRNEYDTRRADYLDELFYP